MKHFIAIAILVVSSCEVWAQGSAPADASAFTPFQQWMGAVLTGDATTLKGLYSTNPPSQVRLKTVMHPGDDDTNFWLEPEGAQHESGNRAAHHSSQQGERHLPRRCCSGHS